ncbi:MAG: hypothetical protein HQL13_04340 [Candidatus Omnitrophica bacterium]|nr:hypothetical protein [Candidatus Omnitrophota bacterium]
MVTQGRVFVVCAIDTEGPIDDARKPEILNSWDRVDALVERLKPKDFRMTTLDSQGRGLVYSWFILHLTGFKTNPFKRAMGYHAVFDHYLKQHGMNFQDNEDGIYWHYHHPAVSGIGNEWCRDWTHCTEYYNILSRLVIERNFFPACFRAGGRIEDDDLSNWIEQWIPFDFSNNSGQVNWDQIESDGKRLGDICDWSRASLSWRPYHPSADDYQALGDQKRWMFRCPDLDSPVHQLRDEDIRQAFREAQAGKDTVLAFFEHDRRDSVIDKIKNVCLRIKQISDEFREVPWFYTNAKEAAQKCLGLDVGTLPRFKVSVYGDNRILILGEEPIFGQAPFVCTRGQDVFEQQPVSAIGQRKWLTGRLDLKLLQKLGVAASNPSGEAGVMVFSYDHDHNSFSPSLRSD